MERVLRQNKERMSQMAKFASRKQIDQLTPSPPEKKPLSKRVQTKLYVEFLQPKYPNFLKTQIAGAVVSSNNNLHLAQMMLDLKKSVKYILKDSFKNENVLTNQNFNSYKPKKRLPALGTFPKLDSVKPVPFLKKEFSSSSSTLTANSSVYDFSDEDTENKIPTFSHVKKRTINRCRRKKRVGVIIMRKANGEYKCRLLR